MSKSKAAISRMSRKKDQALSDYVDALVEHGKGENAIVASRRRKFEKATLELHNALKEAVK